MEIWPEAMGFTCQRSFEQEITNLLREDVQPAKSSANYAVSLVKFCSSWWCWCCAQFRIDMRSVVLKKDVSVLNQERLVGRAWHNCTSDHQQQNVHPRGRLSWSAEWQNTRFQNQVAAISHFNWHNCRKCYLASIRYYV